VGPLYKGDNFSQSSRLSFQLVFVSLPKRTEHHHHDTETSAFHSHIPINAVHAGTLLFIKLARAPTGRKSTFVMALKLPDPDFPRKSDDSQLR
jgi:hypothetical protein